MEPIDTKTASKTTRSVHDVMGMRDIVAGLEHVLANHQENGIAFGALQEPLRQSQIEMLAGIKDHIDEGASEGHIVAPGGSGKTRMGIALGAAVNHHGRKTLFVVDRQESLQKFAREARKLFPNMPVGEVYAEEKVLGDLTFITYNSLLSRVRAFREGRDVKDGAPINPDIYDMVIWDEDHMYLTPNAQGLKKEFARAVNIGMTATPRYYEGKEAGDFSPLIKEIPYATALEHGEVNAYSNHLINTGIHTGLGKLHADQEESAAVGHASNRRDRNLIAADLYRNGSVMQEGKAVPLAGMKSIVLVSTIDHANDQAETINEALMPALKHDSVFRQALRDKGIDPDKVERIAAPLHSGASIRFSGIKLADRNKEIDDYNASKTLMLVSTRLLQQSHDSPQTQLLIDTVPRMTYVGVGQGGYRATRTSAGKGPSVILNYEDADRKSLTFDDFTRARLLGAEQGVVFPELKRNPNFQKASSVEGGMGGEPASYAIMTAGSMANLLRERDETRLAEKTAAEVPASAPMKAKTKPSSTGFRHFKQEDYKHINALMTRIGKGDLEAKEEFALIASPFVHSMAKRLGGRILGEEADEETLKEVAQHVLLILMENNDLFRENPKAWSKFTSRAHKSLTFYLTVEQNELEREAEVKTLLIADIPPDNTPETAVFNKQRKSILEEAIKAASITARESKVQKLRFEHDLTYDETGKAFDVSKQRIREIEAKSIRKLRQPYITDTLNGLDDIDSSKIPISMAEQIRSYGEGWTGIGNYKKFRYLEYKDAEDLRQHIRRSLPTYGGVELTDDKVRQQAELSAEQWHALMKANLSTNSAARKLLLKDEKVITHKMLEAFYPGANYKNEKWVLLSSNIRALIMKAQHISESAEQQGRSY